MSKKRNDVAVKNLLATMGKASGKDKAAVACKKCGKRKDLASMSYNKVKLDISNINA